MAALSPAQASAPVEYHVKSLAGRSQQRDVMRGSDIVHPFRQPATQNFTKFYKNRIEMIIIIVCGSVLITTLIIALYWRYRRVKREEKTAKKGFILANAPARIPSKAIISSGTPGVLPCNYNVWNTQFNSTPNCSYPRRSISPKTLDHHWSPSAQLDTPQLLGTWPLQIQRTLDNSHKGFLGYSHQPQGSQTPASLHSGQLTDTRGKTPRSEDYLEQNAHFDDNRSDPKFFGELKSSPKSNTRLEFRQAPKLTPSHALEDGAYKLCCSTPYRTRSDQEERVVQSGQSTRSAEPSSSPRLGLKVHPSSTSLTFPSIYNHHLMPKSDPAAVGRLPSFFSQRSSPRDTSTIPESPTSVCYNTSDTKSQENLPPKTLGEDDNPRVPVTSTSEPALGSTSQWVNQDHSSIPDVIHSAYSIESLGEEKRGRPKGWRLNPERISVGQRGIGENTFIPYNPPRSDVRCLFRFISNVASHKKD